MSFAIHTPDDELVGFLLFADEGNTSGDCIFRAFPPTNTPVSEWIQHLQDQGEFRWQAGEGCMRILAPDGSEIGFIADGRLTTGGHSLPVVDMTGS
jgi:hypothetical protein